MERNYDEVISEMLIELEQLHRESAAQAERNAKFDRRMELTIKRMVMAEKRLEKIEQRFESSEKRFEEAMREFKNFIRTQNEINRYFLREIRKDNPKK